MKSRVAVSFIGIFIALVLLGGVCSAGFIAGRTTALSPKTSASLFSPARVTSTVAVTTTEELFIPFWEAWQIVHDYYVDQPVDEEAMMQGAVRGMLDSLGDQHTSYMDPIQYRDATTTLTGRYEGIGAWVNTDGTYLTITEPMKGSPAEKAGLLPGDQIVAIDGVDMTGIFPELARQRVLGPAGSKVTLTILRSGLDEIFDVEVFRASITVPSVETKLLDGNVAYIRLRTFGDNTNSELRTGLRTLLSSNPVGLILDLRNNSGGGLDTAVSVASEFIAEGIILYEEYGDGTRDVYTARRGGMVTTIPLVVLVNGFSASASEVVAGAIQDYQRGVLVGEITFGKGSIQRWIPLTNEQGAVRVTIARYLTPNERDLHEIGLTPDYEVALTEEDFLTGEDPQLDKAIELLVQGN